jgi:hypothetical protein
MSDAATFTCALCGGTFEKGWSEEEELAEAAASFSPAELEDAAVLCDDCYQPFAAALPGIRAQVGQEAAAAGLSYDEFVRQEARRP